MNKFIGVGNLTKDLELRTVGADKNVVSFTIAINESRDKVEFINCVAWDKLAINLCKYQGKGSKILVEGRVTTRSYQANDGGTKYATEVVCYSIEYLSKAREQAPDYSQSFENHEALALDNDSLPF